MDNSYSNISVLSKSTNDTNNLDISISDQLASFGRLRISALTKAAEISPNIKEVTIGPRSPLKKEGIMQEKLRIKPEEVIDLLEDKLGDDLRHLLLLKKCEAKLQETSLNLSRNLSERITEARERYRKKQIKDSQSMILSLRARELNMIKKFNESDNIAVSEEAKLDEQKSHMMNKQTKENMNRIFEEQMFKERITRLTDSHTNINICYHELINVIESDKFVEEIGLKHMTTVHDILKNTTNIMNLFKNQKITDDNVQLLEGLALKIKNIKEKIINEASIAKNEQILRIQKEEEMKNKKLEEKRAEEELLKKEQQKAEQLKKLVPIFYSDSNYAYYLELRNYLAEYENKYIQLLEDSSFKKFKFDCQKAINTPINALSCVSGAHMKKTLEKLAKFLRGEKVQISDEYVSASSHPQGLYYCNALLAKKIVCQGDLLVSSKPEAAFPLAAVTVALWVEFPEFGKLLEAYFHRQCPYLVPMFVPQKEGQTDKEFYLSRGYTYNDENVVEKQDKFLKRMSGIFRLRCAIWISKTPSFISAPNPHGLKHGWKWLASFINLKPEPDICATLLHDFFTVCGDICFKHYGKQFTKIIKLISTKYLSILHNIDEGGPKIRLEVFLQNILDSGTIPPPSGLITPNTW